MYFVLRATVGGWVGLERREYILWLRQKVCLPNKYCDSLQGRTRQQPACTLQLLRSLLKRSGWFIKAENKKIKKIKIIYYQLAIPIF